MKNNNKTKKEMTIDDLALMVAKGFNDANERMNKRFDQVDKRFEKIESRLKNIEADLNKKLDKIEHNTLIYRVEKLEKKFA
ncbi:MAG: hypothetical protein WC682_02815 [Parcubacteria group bacterium]|jgi:chaperonin cofactor prefoldin